MTTTLRPWETYVEDDGYIEVRHRGDGVESALFEHIALVPLEPDADLIVEAVNNYDRLCAIEATALALVRFYEMDAVPIAELGIPEQELRRVLGLGDDHAA